LCIALSLGGRLVGCGSVWGNRENRTGFDLAVKGALEAGDEVHFEAGGVEEHLYVN